MANKTDFSQDIRSANNPLDGAASDGTALEWGGVTPRVVVLCLALAFGLGYIIPIIDFALFNTFLGATHMPVGGIAILLGLALIVNPILRTISNWRGRRGKGGFSRQEVLTVYITSLFSCLVPGTGAENYVIPNLIAPFYYATSENRWLTFLEPYLKLWMTPALSGGNGYDTSARKVVEGWYTGIPANEAIPWGAWMVPLLTWGIFIFISYLMLGCLGVILRAQWAEREALRFPLLQLPLTMTEDIDRADRSATANRFFRNPMMWTGFGIAASIQLMNGLHMYFPDVPKIPLTLETAALFAEAPWTQIGRAAVIVLPLAVGIAYLLTSEVAFSMWFFFWFIKFQYIVAYTLGFSPQSMPNAIGNTGEAKVFTQYQQIGAFLMYVGLMLWMGREHFKHVACRAIGRAKATEDEKHEALPYPVAFWGFLLSFSFMVGWSMLAGMSFWVALALWSIYLIISIGLTRIVVESGMLFVQPGWTPLGSSAQLFNSGPGTWLDPNSIVPASVMQNAMMVNIRGFLLPSFLQSFKLAHDYKIKARPLMAMIIVVTLISLCMGLVMNVRLGYRTGGLQMFHWFTSVGPLEPPNNTSALISGTNGANAGYLGWLAVGGLTTYGIIIARGLLTWFPLHPIGFLVSMTYPMSVLWASVFLGWMCKVLIMRFGGGDTYKKTTPLFLGLVLGDVFMMIIWLMVDGFSGRIHHQLLF